MSIKERLRRAADYAKTAVKNNAEYAKDQTIGRASRAKDRAVEGTRESARNTAERIADPKKRQEYREQQKKREADKKFWKEQQLREDNKKREASLKLKEKQLRLVERERKLQENYQDAQRQQAQKRQGFLDDTGSNRGSLTSGSNFTNSSMFGNNNNGRRRF